MTDASLLHRQINPSWVQQGRVTSQAFRPTPKDQKKLSVYDGDQITAELAWKHFTSQLHLSSIGVLSIAVSECHATSVVITPDPTPYPEHVVVDFTGHDENTILKIGKQLRNRAESRGWQYQAT
jgi:hypothetical protein